MNKKNAKNKFWKANSRGFSLVELMATLGIIATMGYVIVTFKVDMAKHGQTLKNKLETMEIEESLLRLFADSRACRCMFRGLEWLPDSESTLNLNSLKNGCEVGADDNAVNLLQVGQSINSQSLLNVNSIKLRNMRDIDTEKKVADLEISFDTPASTLKSKPVSIPSLHFTVNANQVSHCLEAGAATTPITKCAADQRVFVGFSTFNGQTPDGNGCLPMSAFQGPRGQQGAVGPRGIPTMPPEAAIPVPPLSSRITVSGTYGAQCPNGYTLISCTRTGSGNNNGWYQNRNGCIAWEGRGNHGSLGCSCECALL